MHNVPPELTRHKAWLVWQLKAQENGKKPLKIPRYTDGAWRKGTQGTREDRQKLATFEVALSTMEKSKGRYKGLGFALMPEWGLVAVDFDDCVVDGEVMPAVAELVAPTYWEFSPSGNGIRAFFKGHVRDAKSLTKEARAKRGGWGVEFFCSNGFVTITGNVAPEVELVGPDIVPLTPAIMALYDDACGSKDANVENSDQPIVGMNDEEIRRMLESWDADCDYETWLNVGMAIHHETHGEGFELWNEWSATGSKYEGQAECEYKWESFGRAGKKSLKTIRWMINEKGLDFTLENAIVDGELGGKLAPLGGEGKKPMGKPKGLKVKENGEIEATVGNVLAWLRCPHLTNMELAYDTFRDELMWQPCDAKLEWQAFTDADYTRLRESLEAKGFRPIGRELIRDCVHLVGIEHTIDTAKVWLDSLKWDGVPRVATFFPTYMGTEDSDYTRALGVYVWTAHAARIEVPGHKADIMPVLVSTQRMGKSESIEALAPSEDFFTEIDFKVRDADLSRKMRGCLVAECAELQGMAGRELESVKAFISRRFEKWTPKYKELETSFSRRLLFWGTSNRHDFLSDPTGNRRFAPVMTTGCHRELILRDREQLWAEGKYLFEMLGVDTDELVELAKGVHTQFTLDDPLEEQLVERLPAFVDGPNYQGRLSFLDVAESVLGVMGMAEQAALSRKLGPVMTKLGWERKRGTGGARCWVRKKGA